jgi:hypothetical protein
MASIGEDSETGNIRNVIRIDESEIRNYLDGLVKASVEEVLNQYLDQDSDQQCPGKA